MDRVGEEHHDVKSNGEAVRSEGTLVALYRVGKMPLVVLFVAVTQYVPTEMPANVRTGVSVGLIVWALLAWAIESYTNRTDTEATRAANEQVRRHRTELASLRADQESGIRELRREIEQIQAADARNRRESEIKLAGIQALVLIAAETRPAVDRQAA
jgi:hypothetical protein